MDEKKDDLQLPLVNERVPTRQTCSWKKTAFWAGLSLLTLSLCFRHSHRHGPHAHPHHHSWTSKSACHQVPAIKPVNQSSELHDMDKYIASNDFRSESIKRLSGAVQVPTESFDDLGPIGEDQRWEVMYKFADYLRDTFPVVHATLAVEKINTHALLYTWHGSNVGLKPTLLMAHQDVVPVPAATIDQWTYPPFSGYFDGENIWGRGASDCKNQLIGIMEAVEELIKAGFQPERSVVMPFGFDEEVSGPQGAGHLAPFLLERYGKDGIAVVVDEGAGFQSAWGMRAALPGVGEKGYTDIHITVRMPGGHSSIPPDHTGIGVMSQLISAIEDDQYDTHLAAENPFLGLLQCGAEHAPQFPKKLDKLLKKHKSASTCSKKHKHTKDKLALEAAKLGPSIRYLMQTSIAADIISGGVKNNALPERTIATINHRVNIGESTQIVRDKISKIARHVAKQYNLTLHAFNGEKETPSSITLEGTHQTLEPAPITPTDAHKASAWTVLSGTTRALYGEDLIVAPGLMTGNTDTKYYWDLTKHIFRFTPGWDEKNFGLGKIHTVDESISVENHINMVKWMSLFIRNMDQSDLA